MPTPPSLIIDGFPAMPPPPPKGTCSDDDVFIRGLFKTDCEGVKAYCTGEFSALIAGACPATCDTCFLYCADNNAMMALWATQNKGWPTSCAEATNSSDTAVLDDAVFMLACGASSSYKGCIDEPGPGPEEGSGSGADSGGAGGRRPQQIY